MKTIAVIAKTAALAAALTAQAKAKFPAYQIVNVEPGSPPPAGAALFGVNMPGFTTSPKTVVLKQESRIVQGTPEERSATRRADWEILSSEDSTVEEITAVLGNVQEYHILKGEAIGSIKSVIADTKMALAEAADLDDPEAAKDAKLAALLPAFKELATLLG